MPMAETDGGGESVRLNFVPAPRPTWTTATEPDAFAADAH